MLAKNQEHAQSCKGSPSVRTTPAVEAHADPHRTPRTAAAVQRRAGGKVESKIAQWYVGVYALTQKGHTTMKQERAGTLGDGKAVFAHQEGSNYSRGPTFALISRSRGESQKKRPCYHNIPDQCEKGCPPESSLPTLPMWLARFPTQDFPGKGTRDLSDTDAVEKWVYMQFRLLRTPSGWKMRVLPARTEEWMGEDAMRLAKENET